MSKNTQLKSDILLFLFEQEIKRGDNDHISFSIEGIKKIVLKYNEEDIR